MRCVFSVTSWVRSIISRLGVDEPVRLAHRYWVYRFECYPADRRTGDVVDRLRDEAAYRVVTSNTFTRRLLEPPPDVAVTEPVMPGGLVCPPPVAKIWTIVPAGA